MNYSDMVKETWDHNVLFSVLLELTYRCNLDCSFCYNDLSLEGTPLAYGQYLELLEDLAKMGTMNLILTGGEPLAHPRFLDIGERARELGFVVRIKSNGHARSGALARSVRDRIDPFLIEVSLHGGCAATHDQQTRVEGSFDRLMKNLAELSELGLRVKINSTLTRLNEHEIDVMFGIADSFGMRLQIDPEGTPRDDGDMSPLEMSASAEGLRKLHEVHKARFDEVAETGPAEPAAARSLKHCGAGSSGLAIDPFGNVYPCVQWRRKVGSLHEARIGDLWHGSPVLGVVRRTTVEVRETLLSMGSSAPPVFCPGSAEANTGSPLSMYSAAIRRRQSESDPDEAASVLSLPVLQL